MRRIPISFSIKMGVLDARRRDACLFEAGLIASVGILFDRQRNIAALAICSYATTAAVKIFRRERTCQNCVPYLPMSVARRHRAQL